jgi:arylsulfatase A-like enzyme
MRDHGGSAGELREGKQYAFEGGMRVPTLAWWKGIIKPGSVEKEMAAMTDWFPTFLSLAGIEAPSHIVDGEDISGVLTGDSERANHEFLYFKGSALTAYRNGDWKLKMPFDGTEPATWRLAVDPHPMLLINLVEDPGESNNLAEKYPERVKQMRARMEELYDNMGELPEGKVIKIQADNSHYEHLRVKYGEDWYKK